MKLLIITQKVDKDDSYFGFFHDWLLEFAKACEKVTVITLERRAFELPNVTVLSLGKEDGVSKWTYIYRLNKYIWCERKNYSAVFAHMSPWYVIVGAPLFMILRKKVALWYTHRAIDFKLRLAVYFSSYVFSASKEGFRLKSKKSRIVGHGIVVQKFSSVQRTEKKGELRLLSVGRITPIKNLEVLIDALAHLERKGVHAQLDLVGEPLLPKDVEYARHLKGYILEKNLGEKVRFLGAVPNYRIPQTYAEHDIHVNLAPTGGLDKAVYEASAVGIPSFVSNKAFIPFLGDYTDVFLFKENDGADLASKIVSFLERTDSALIEKYMRERVEEYAGLDRLIKKVLVLLQ